MKCAYLLIFLFLLVFQTPVYSQGVLAVESEKINFGDIMAVQNPVSKSVTVRNTGDRPVIITRISSLTTQVKVNWDRQPLLPGKSGEIQLVFTPAQLPEKFDYSVVVYSNAVNNRLELGFSGHIADNPEQPYLMYKYDIDGLKFKITNLNLDRVYTWEKRCDTVYYYNTRKEDVSLGVHYQPSHVSTVFVPEKVRPGQKGSIIVTYDAPKKNDYGYHYESIILTINNFLDYQNRIGITANLVEDFSRMSARERAEAPVAVFDKTEINFGELRQGEKANCDFVLTNAGKSTLFIRKTKPSCGCTAVTLGDQKVEAGKSTTVRATFDSAGKTGRQIKSVTVITNDPEHPETVLNLKGSVKPE